jgi:exosortase
MPEFGLNMKSSADSLPTTELSFRDDIRRLSAAFPHKALFGTLILGWFALFHFFGNSTLGYRPTHSIFGWLNFMYETVQDDAFGAVVPLLVAGLLWWQRDDLAKAPKRVAPSAMGLVLAAIGLHLVGFVIQQPRLSVVAFFFGLGGWVALVWGWRFFGLLLVPSLLFFFSIPLSQLAEPLTFPLRMIVSKVSVGVSHGIFGIDVQRDGSLIFNSARTFQYDVAPACSGIRSLTALGCLAFVYALISFKTWWRRLVLMGAVIPLAVAGNILRIITVIVVAEMAGQEAGKKIETNLGFLTFAVALLGMFLIERALPSERAPDSHASDPGLPLDSGPVPREASNPTLTDIQNEH